jgi:hypothetical protein
LYAPAAQAFVAEVAATLLRVTPDGQAGLGLVTLLHVVPFQCSTRVCSVVFVAQAPTAQALVEEVGATVLTWSASGSGQ